MYVIFATALFELYIAFIVNAFEPLDGTSLEPGRLAEAAATAAVRGVPWLVLFWSGYSGTQKSETSGNKQTRLFNQIVITRYCSYKLYFHKQIKLYFPYL